MIKKLKFVIVLLVGVNLLGAGMLSELQEKHHLVGQVLGASSIPQFDPSYVMSDYTFSSKRVFPNQDSIQRYLDSQGSVLANYKDNGKLASQIIYEASSGISSSKYGITPNLNPGVVLAFLEKEQSLISLKNYDTQNDPENRIGSAMGMGCPDNAKCDSEYKGFTNQLIWGVFQLQYNLENANKSTGDNYKLNKTIQTLDNYSVNLSTAATAAAYRYTPHVYWGNYSLWKIITANGWGNSSQRYSYQDLNDYNLKNKNNPINTTDTQQFADVKNLKLEPTNSVINGVEIMSYSDQYCETLKQKNWQQGETSGEVERLQKCLQSNNLFTWKNGITGYLGGYTWQQLNIWKVSKALIATQPTNQSTNSGVNEIKLVKKPIAETIVTGPKNNTLANGVIELKLNVLGNNDNNCQTLKRKEWTFGENSGSVKNLQDCMQNAGVFNWKYGSTGYFGQVTQDALQSWRKN